MKKLLLLLAVFAIASCSVDKVQSDCNCEKVYYEQKVKMEGVTPIWYYVKVGSENTTLCDETGMQSLGGNKFVKIECE